MSDPASYRQTLAQYETAEDCVNMIDRLLRAYHLEHKRKADIDLVLSVTFKPEPPAEEPLEEPNPYDYPKRRRRRVTPTVRETYELVAKGAAAVEHPYQVDWMIRALGDPSMLTPSTSTQ